ncbi:MAG: 2,3-bisphosphoglycerate-independent phosphoglycerate mutase [Verrucomicrobia bacterium]|nr:2,3-bisphosphoglycerate-independent phosphoglycerate mutase [Verrucomicrobiota bacterium]
MEALKKIDGYSGPEGPVVLVIMDGVGIGKYEEGDMVRRATTPMLDWLSANVVKSQLKAHGTAVGLPSDDEMGNSEVGHNAIGAGRVFSQGASLVNDAIENGSLFDGDTWKELVGNCTQNSSTLHFIGLLSDGYVHSHISHLEAMLKSAKAEGVTKVRVHALLDGRDVPPTSALEYIDRLEAFLSELNADGSVDFRIGSGGGRMNITMDRYGANWPMVGRGWNVHVRGDGPQADSAREAVEAARAANRGVIDQDLPPFVIVEDGEPIGRIVDGDSVILFNFRGDRAMELTRAFEEEDFSKFDRGPRRDVKFAGMMQYDGDLGIPAKFLVAPPALSETTGEYLALTGVKQLAVSETQKFGHVTYFFNGNRTDKFNEELEDYVEITSDILPFEERPWMKAAEITDVVLKAMGENSHNFIRLNYPNGDMVGHTGNLLAVEISVETVDLHLARLMKAAEKAGGILVVTADHGNADDMFEHDKKTGAVKYDADGNPRMKTSHSLNPVPVYIYDPSGISKARLSSATNLGISSLAATCIKLLGYEPPENYDPSIVDVG